MEEDDARSVDVPTVSASAVEEEDRSMNCQHFHANEEQDDADEDSKVVRDLLHRPIVVGYSFGPKKMSTMGVVMAEASKTGLSTDMVLPPLLHLVQRVRRSKIEDDGKVDCAEKTCDSHSRYSRAMLPTNSFALTREVLSSFADEQHKDLHFLGVNMDIDDGNKSRDTNMKDIGPIRSSVKKTSSLETSQDSDQIETKQALPSAVWFNTGEHQYSSPSDSPGTAAGGTGQIHHRPRPIVRHLGSFSPSVSSWGSTGTRTASTAASVRTYSASRPVNTTGATGTTVDSSSITRTSTAGSAGASARNKVRQKSYPIRVSFVPLDPEIPLEEQHGGIDVILHKLTEDILLLSQLSLKHPQLKTTLQLNGSSLDTVLNEVDLSESDSAAIRRVHRLSHFQRSHGCSLVDDPASVQTLMSRADIADVLKDSLSGVTSSSGIPVQSPRYAVVNSSSSALTVYNCSDERSSKLGSKNMMFDAIQKAQLSFPLIAKPLTAAGTKASHSMAVVTHPSGLEFIADRVPCLLQEYANHNSVLYKVYVLGDFVSVYKRRSLPNLPSSITTPRQGVPVVIEFDSQRPYPRLKDFGYRHSEVPSRQNPDSNQTLDDKVTMDAASTSSLPPFAGKSISQKTLDLTPEEVRPIVEVLKRAFGLEMFGFDVLLKATTESDGDITREEEDKPAMLVVDVNYFPSYKEVPDFPALLAKFLTSRAIQGRLERMVETTSAN